MEQIRKSKFSMYGNLTNINKAYRPNAHLLDILMHYNINIIIMLHY